MVNLNDIDIDIDDVSSDFPVLTAGTYAGVIVESSLEVSKTSGKDMVKLRIEVEHDGLKHFIYDFIIIDITPSDSDFLRAKYARMLKVAYGVETLEKMKENNEEFEIDDVVSLLVDKGISLEVEVELYNDRKQNKIKGLIKPLSSTPTSKPKPKAAAKTQEEDETPF